MALWYLLIKESDATGKAVDCTGNNDTGVKMLKTLPESIVTALMILVQ